jgi:hypothetical protein
MRVSAGISETDKGQTGVSLHAEAWKPAELELSVLNRQGLTRWIPRIDRMREEAAAWNLKRNQERVRSTGNFPLPTSASNSDGSTRNFNRD